MRYRIIHALLVGVITVAIAGLALTSFSLVGANERPALAPSPASGTLVHCKSISHLAVDAKTSTAPRSTATATYLPTMHCHNNAGYTGWGVVVSIRARKPLDGLHLYPETAMWLPGQLRFWANAATPGKVVVIRHTIGGQSSVFAALTPADARALASQIEAAIP